MLSLRGIEIKNKMKLEDLSALNFEESDKKFEEILNKINNIGVKYDLCSLRAKTYKYLAQIDGIREEAKKRAEYYLQEAEKYKEM